MASSYNFFPLPCCIQCLLLLYWSCCNSCMPHFVISSNMCFPVFWCAGSFKLEEEYHYRAWRGYHLVAYKKSLAWSDLSHHRILCTQQITGLAEEGLCIQSLKGTAPHTASKVQRLGSLFPVQPWGHTALSKTPHSDEFSVPEVQRWHVTSLQCVWRWSYITAQQKKGSVHGHRVFTGNTD